MTTPATVQPPPTTGDGNAHRHEHAHAHADIPKDLPNFSTPAVLLAALIALGAFVALFLVGWIPRHHRLAQLEAESRQVNDSRPSVDVAQPKRDAKPIEVVLPADARAYQETAIYSRANGYLKSQTVDIGDHVKVGQLLAEIDAPDLDAELNQAKASVVASESNLAKAKSDRDLAEITLKRFEEYAKSGGVTQQDLDTRRATFAQTDAAYAQSKADVAIQQANVQRLTALVGFEKITAPFTGVITARNYDVGALLSSTNTGRPLFNLAQIDVLRVFVNVPQSYVTQIKTGQEARLTVRNYPGRTFTGKITRSTGALDPNSRTLRYEIDFPNSDDTLYSGMYGQVTLPVNQDQSPMRVPTSALVFDSAGTKVWVVDDGKARARLVSVGRDFGTEVEINSGLSGSEAVVTNPGQRLAEGVAVNVSSPASPIVPGTPPHESQASTLR